MVTTCTEKPKTLCKLSAEREPTVKIWTFSWLWVLSFRGVVYSTGHRIWEPALVVFRATSASYILQLCWHGEGAIFGLDSICKELLCWKPSHPAKDQWPGTGFGRVVLDVGGLEAPDADGQSLAEDLQRTATTCHNHVCDQGRGDLYSWQHQTPHSTIQSGCVLRSCRGTSPSWAKNWPLGNVRNWSWNHICCWLWPEKGVDQCWPSVQVTQLSWKSWSVRAHWDPQQFWFRTDRCMLACQDGKKEASTNMCCP